jgi:hypothetical protein
LEELGLPGEISVAPGAETTDREVSVDAQAPHVVGDSTSERFDASDVTPLPECLPPHWPHLTGFRTSLSSAEVRTCSISAASSARSDCRGPEDVKALTYEAFVRSVDAQAAGPIERNAAVALEIWNLWRRHHDQPGLRNGQFAATD